MAADLIAEMDAHIVWNLDGKRRVTDVLVLSRAAHLATPYADRIVERSYRCSGGACSSDWLSGADPADNAAALFAELSMCWGFVSFDHYVRALGEFSKIDSCAWARQQHAFAMKMDERDPAIEVTWVGAARNLA